MKSFSILTLSIIGTILLLTASLKANSDDEEETSYKVSFTRKTPQDVFSAKVEFPNKDFTFGIKRGRHTIDSCKEKLIPLFSDVYLFFQGGVFIPKLYAALTYFTGPCDDDYDDFKGSFSFYFVLDAEKKGKKSRYVYWLRQVRSYVDAVIYEISPSSDPRETWVLYNPTEDMPSKTEVGEFTKILFTSLVADIDKRGYDPEPYILEVPSNLLISGYTGGYFSESWKEESVYDARVNEFLDYIKEYKKGYKTGVRIGRLKTLLEFLDTGYFTEEVFVKQLGASSEEARQELHSLLKKRDDAYDKKDSSERTCVDESEASPPNPKRIKRERSEESDGNIQRARLMILLRYISKGLINEKAFMGESRMSSEDARLIIDSRLKEE